MSKKCQTCGYEIPDDAPGSTCPACDFRSALSLGDDLEGKTIGNYKIVSKIGAGGFGVVYLALQTEPVRRQVAFKILKRDRISSAIVAQFVAEQQALAVLNHPNIAKIFDAGETEWGAPYFVMELIEGAPITNYCDRKRLTPEERIPIFRDVCGAIQHAHQKAIIHRDIKPSNVLVVEINDKPVPKIIDFGVAKAVGTPLHETILELSLSPVIGTPQYMPPEQARGDSDIDTRADVYSLGILFYELLVGSPPFTRREIRDAGIEAILKMIEEKRPPSPSERLFSMDDRGETVAQNRHLEPPELKKIIRGDLDWIVMKAIEKSRKWRYESATAMARDIDLYLGQRPLATRRRTMGYRTMKFCRRNRALVATAAIFLLVSSVLGIITASVLKDRREVRANTYYDKLFDCRVERLPAVVAEIDSYGNLLDKRLQEQASDRENENRDRMRASLALLPRQPAQLSSLFDWLLEADPGDLAIYLAILEGHESDLEALAWRWIADESADDSKRLRAAAIAAFANSSNSRWQAHIDQIAGWLIDAQSFDAASWIRLFKPLAGEIESQLGKASTTSEQRARLAITLLLMKRPATVWPLLDYSSNPDLRTTLIHRCAPSGVDWRIFVGGLERNRPGVLAAVLVALEEYSSAQLPVAARDATLRPLVETLFADHPHPGVHSSAEWLLRKWDPNADLAALANPTRARNPADEPGWYMTPGGEFTMAVIPMPEEFVMGSPQDEEGRPKEEDDDEKRDPGNPQILGRTVAIASKEVTRRQFMKFAEDTGLEKENKKADGTGFPEEGAMSHVTLQEAMLFCRWLTARDNDIDESEQCYTVEDNEPDHKKNAVTTVEGYLSKGGYRILTEPEWEFACRGGTITSRHFGSAEALLPIYAWYNANTDNESMPPGLLRPNPYGLFDMLGNVTEWCQEPYWINYQPNPLDQVISVKGRNLSYTFKDGLYYAYRGGSYYNPKVLLRAARRGRTNRDAHPFTGFRVARTISN